MLIKFSKVEVVQKDNRGYIYGFEVPKRFYHTILFRKKGTVSGRHFHSGKTKSKNPEIFYIIKGKIKFLVRNLETKEEEIHEFGPGMLVEVPAKIYHELHALKNTYFLELNYSKKDFENQETTKLE